MGFELDEFIYSKFVKYIKNRRLNKADVLNKQVLLVDIQPRLSLLAKALCGENIEIFPAEREGGFKNNNFFLPIQCALFSTKELNQQFYIFSTKKQSCR